MNSTKMWIYRALVIGAAALIILSFLLPWWTTDILEVGLMNAMTMRAFGLEHQLGEYTAWAEASFPPQFLTTLAYIYFVVVMGAIVASMFLKQPQGGLILFLAGLAYLGYSLIAFGYAVYSMSKWGISPTGYSYVDETKGLPWHTGIISTILPGFYVAIGSSFVTMVVSFLRNKITGETAVFWRKARAER